MIVARLPHYEAHLRPVHDLLGETDVALVASYGDLVEAQRTHDRIVLMQHGIGQSYSDSNPHYPGGKGNDSVGLFLAPNEHSAGRWRSAYPRARVEVVGSPRLDDLPRRLPGPGPVIAVSWHWDAYHHPEARSAFDYYRAVLPELAERFTVIGHGHPRRRDMERKWAALGVEYVPDFDDVCRRADVYVADNTSTLYEFASTGRNVVVLNAPFYRREVNHGLRFWEASHVGINVNQPDQLVPAVGYAATVDDSVSREDALNIVYGVRTNAAAYAATAITDWLHEGRLAA